MSHENRSPYAIEDVELHNIQIHQPSAATTADSPHTPRSDGGTDFPSLSLTAAEESPVTGVCCKGKLFGHSVHFNTYSWFIFFLMLTASFGGILTILITSTIRHSTSLSSPSTRSLTKIGEMTATPVIFIIICPMSGDIGIRVIQTCSHLRCPAVEYRELAIDPTSVVSNCAGVYCLDVCAGVYC
jgi:hypothetical protein